MYIYLNFIHKYTSYSCFMQAFINIYLIWSKKPLQYALRLCIVGFVMKNKTNNRRTYIMSKEKVVLAYGLEQ